MVAEDESEGQVVGFGATTVRSGVLYLADLFVLPSMYHVIADRSTSTVNT